MVLSTIFSTNNTLLTRSRNLNIAQGIWFMPKFSKKSRLIKHSKMSEERIINNFNFQLEYPSTNGSTDGSFVNISNVQHSDYERTSNQSSGNISEESIYFQNISHLMLNPVLVEHNIDPNITNNWSYQYYNTREIPLPLLNSDVDLQQNLFRRYFRRHQSGEDPQNNVGKSKDQELALLRVWENVNKGKPNNKPGFIFTLMSYNVLAQDLLEQHPHLYHLHNQQLLNWETRWSNLFNEIKNTNPDILCLQEVQESHIQNYYTLLETLGYSGIYKKRTGVRTDGCTLYYKVNNINLVEHTMVEYYQPGVSILNRDNVGIVAKFAPKLHPTREFIVATTHLLYNPRRQDVRVAQMQLLLTDVEKMSYKKKGNQCFYLPVILTGDLNSQPHSPLYDFITKGKLKYEHLSLRLRSDNTANGKILVPPRLRITDNCQHIDLIQERLKNEAECGSEEKLIVGLNNAKKYLQNRDTTIRETNLFSTGTLSHNFVLKSVYNHGIPENCEGTTFQNKWLTVDYIFYSVNENNTEDKMKLLSKYRLPTQAELNGVRIPNTILGSDHFSLTAKFKLEY